jgi:hypothetical protein
MNPLATLPNPFGAYVVNDAWNELSGDVASINAAAFQVCLDALSNVRRGQPDSVLVRGPAGSGKTHLLARLQRHLVHTASEAADGALHCVFVSLKLQTNARTLWQFVRRRLAVDLMRENEGVTQLARLVAHQIAIARREPARQWVRGIRVLPSAEDISGIVDEVAEPLGLGRGLGLVLGHLVHRRNIAVARAWLAGESLSECDLTTLGLPTTEPENREEDARQIVTALCRLASESLPMVFCFDQIEALQTSPSDTDSLFQFARVAAELSEADRNVLLISSIQSTFVSLWEKSVRGSDRERAFRRSATLLTLSREQIDALLRSRMDTVKELRELRAARASQPLYPLPPEVVESLHNLPVPVPRRVFARAEEAFAHLQGLQRSKPILEEFLAGSLARRHSAALAESKPRESAEILRHGLPMLWDLQKGVLRPSSGGTEFTLGDPAATAIAICNEDNMKTLAARLRHLRGAGDSSRAALRIVRDPRLPIKRTAKKALEYLAELQKGGARLVSPTVEALAALEALRTLLSDARAGDLALDGEPVGEGGVREWLTRHLDPALLELTDELAGAGTSGGGDDPQIGALCDLMVTELIAPLDEVAAKLELDGERVRSLVAASGERIGMLHGPPAVLFLRIPAETLSARGE